MGIKNLWSSQLRFFPLKPDQEKKWGKGQIGAIKVAFRHFRPSGDSKCCRHKPKLADIAPLIASKRL